MYTLAASEIVAPENIRQPPNVSRSALEPLEEDVKVRQVSYHAQGSDWERRGMSREATGSVQGRPEVPEGERQ